MERRPLVVCVDDDPRVGDALQRELRREPVEVRATTDPRQVLEWIAREDVALVISDERMPEICGSVLLHQVRERAPRTARLVLTAYPEDVSEPGVRMLTKPWRADELRRAIRELVEHAIVVECRGRTGAEILPGIAEELRAGRRLAIDLRHLPELRDSVSRFLKDLVREMSLQGFRAGLIDRSGLADTMSEALQAPPARH